MQTISKELRKLISSLAYKKYRQEIGLFLAEGKKLIKELSNCFECELLIATAQWGEKEELISAKQILIVAEEEVQRCSLQENRRDALALFHLKNWTFSPDSFNNELILGLEDVQDPGNLGTILRTANWFGIQQIVCSPQTADIYNPKVVQSSMGALGHLKVSYLPLVPLLKSLQNVPIYSTTLCGKSIYEAKLSPKGLLLMGNEGNGLSQEVLKYSNQQLYIPPYPSRSTTVESLNVAVSTAIILSEFRRNFISVPT